MYFLIKHSVKYFCMKFQKTKQYPVCIYLLKGLFILDSQLFAEKSMNFGASGEWKSISVAKLFKINFTTEILILLLDKDLNG